MFYANAFILFLLLLQFRLLPLFFMYKLLHHLMFLTLHYTNQFLFILSNMFIFCHIVIFSFFSSTSKLYWYLIDLHILHTIIWFDLFIFLLSIASFLSTPFLTTLKYIHFCLHISSFNVRDKYLSWLCNIQFFVTSTQVQTTALSQA